MGRRRASVKEKTKESSFGGKVTDFDCNGKMTVDMMRTNRKKRNKMRPHTTHSRDMQNRKYEHTQKTTAIDCMHSGRRYFNLQRHSYTFYLPAIIKEIELSAFIIFGCILFECILSFLLFFFSSHFASFALDSSPEYIFYPSFHDAQLFFEQFRFCAAHS